MSIKQKFKQTKAAIIAKIMIKGAPMTTLTFKNPKIEIQGDKFNIFGDMSMTNMDKDAKVLASNKSQGVKSHCNNDDSALTALLTIIDELGKDKHNLDVTLLVLQIQSGKTESMEIIFSDGVKATASINPLTAK